MGFWAKLFGGHSAEETGDINFSRLNRVLGPWSPQKNGPFLPGTRLPRELDLPRGVSRHGLPVGRQPLSGVLFPCWLRLSPRLAHFICREIRLGRIYTRQELPRENKPPRVVYNPRPILKFMQRRILERLLNQIDVHDAAHGFVRHRSIFTALEKHTGQRLVATLDLRDFFPSITQGRVTGLFRSLGIDHPRARLLARLCCLDGRLPQGAPSSPALANLICRRLDHRLSRLAETRHFNYTRYADDLIFSGSAKVVAVLPLVREIIRDEGFVVADEKTHLRRSGNRQRVLGLNVNTKVAVPRNVRRYLRAMVHQQAKDPFRSADVTGFLMGHLAFVQKAHPEQARRLRKKLIQNA